MPLFHLLGGRTANTFAQGKGNVSSALPYIIRKEIHLRHTEERWPLIIPIRLRHSPVFFTGRGGVEMEAVLWGSK